MLSVCARLIPGLANCFKDCRLQGFRGFDFGGVHGYFSNLRTGNLFQRHAHSPNASVAVHAVNRDLHAPIMTATLSARGVSMEAEESIMRVILSLVLAASAFAADIPAGSHVLLRMQNSINSRTAKPGDFVYLQTATPITAEGGILVPVGSYVRGVVAEVNRAGKV
jgi:hypothetical protein